MAKRPINIALIGYQFMGKAHSNAYRQVSRFFNLDVEPVMKVICGRTEDKVRAARDKFGWQEYATDWREVIQRPDIDLVDVVTPGYAHAEIAAAAAKAGKHVVCEKPLANTLAEAKMMLAAAEQAGVCHTVCYNFRKAPAVALAKQIIDEGRIGKIHHFRGVYLQDWIVDPNFPIVWRLQKDVAGSGSHGDLNAHLIDSARYLVGEFAEVVGLEETFVKQRPKLAESDDRLGGKASEEMGEVTVDDATLFLARFQNGAVATFEASRFCAGRKNHQKFEINGSKGSLVFNVERMNELEVYFHDDPPHLRGFRTIQATDTVHPYTGNYWPVAHIIGYEHTFINLFKDMFDSIARGEMPTPNWVDGMKAQAVLEAAENSAKSRKWEKVDG